MQTYTHYKESGIDWIGQIPEHWVCKRLGNWFEERRKKVSDKDFAPLSVTKNGIVPQLDNAAKSNDGDNRKLVMAGDFVINSRSDRKGSSGLSYLDGSVSLINIVMKPRGIYPKFSEFLLKSNGFIEEFYRNGHGIVADLWTTRYDEMKFIFLAIPPFQEQEAIAKFLDDKTAKIDALVQTKAQQIEKLKELRQAKIHQAVTKGLDAIAPAKYSGVAWIGEIPAHWEVRRLATLGNFSKGGGFSKADLVEENGVSAILYGDIYTKYNYIIKESVRLISNTAASNAIVLEFDDLLFTGSGETKEDIGKCVAFKSKTITVAGGDVIIFKQISNSSNYLSYCLNTEGAKFEKAKSSKGEIIVHTYASKLKEISVPIPSIQEQEQIVAYLDEVTGKIDQAVTQKQEQITKLKEYKQSLINNVVTGKVKVC